ncbi:ester cyclase (plasmid) [Streptomyces viridifaciens]|nr:ester cyclase [Streptomyces viridifaciens]
MHEAFNTRDIAAADEIFAPDFYSHPLQGGVEAVKAAWTAMLTACPTAGPVRGTGRSTRPWSPGRDAA